jgi:hypothetical protein
VVADLTKPYLEAVDEALPGFISMAYVVGSLALGAWEPGRSDIDFVVFTSREPVEGDLATLRELHDSLSGEPYLDGVYISPANRWADDLRVVPFVVDGKFHADQPCGGLTPVLWLTLQRYGVPVRGPSASSLGVEVDLEALRTYNLSNLRTYWQGQAEAIRRFVAGVESGSEVDAEYAAWVLLGPARLHYTLAETDIISKSAAGAYVATRFPEYATLVERAVRWRGGAAETFTADDLSAAATLIDVVNDDAWGRWG